MTANTLPHIVETDLYIPNYGRIIRIVRPVDMDHRYIDPDVDLPILLVSTASSSSVAAHDRHWKVAWQVGISAGSQLLVYRYIDVVQYVGIPHLTNWGPLTKINIDGTQDRTEHEIAVMSLNQRKQLEKIAENTPVRKPNGEWNGQDWLHTVIETAQDQGLISKEAWDRAVNEANEVVKQHKL